MTYSATFTVRGKPEPKGSTGPATADWDRGLRLLRGLIGEEADPEGLRVLVMPGEPMSKARARWSAKSRTFYTPRTTTGVEAALALFLRTRIDGRYEANVAVAAIFFRSNQQRIDADNMMKLVMDAGTKAGIWADDCQVTRQASVVEHDPERPRTVIAIAPVQSSMTRSVMVDLSCARCGSAFQKERRKITKPPKFCSERCQYDADRREARCAKCESVFMRRVAGQRYCSKKCARSAPRKRVRDGVRPWPLCACGKRVSRREYLRCADCRPKGRKRGSKNKPKVGAPGVVVAVMEVK